VVSGDVAYRIIYILAFIGAAPLSIIGILFAEGTVNSMLTNIGESNTIVISAAIAAVFVFVLIFTIVRYPVPEESVLSLWIGLLSSASAGTILWSWLTFEYKYKLPLLGLSEFYTVATLTFVDFLVGVMALLVALLTATERT